MKTLKIAAVVILLAGFAFSGFNQTTIITPLTGFGFGGGGNVTNTGDSVIGMLPVYTDTTGHQVTPTNRVVSFTIDTLYFTGMMATNVPVFSLSTNLVPSRTSTNILDYLRSLSSPTAGQVMTAVTSGVYTNRDGYSFTTNALAMNGNTNNFARADGSMATTPQENLILGHNGTILSSGTGVLYYSITGGGRVSGAAGAMNPMAINGTLSRLYVHISTAQGTGTNITFTIYTNNVASPITCTIAGGSTNATDLTHTTIALPAGTMLTMGMQGNFASSYTASSADWGVILSR